MEGRFRRVVEYILIASTAAVSLVIGVLDLAGLLGANSWIDERVPSLTLIAVGLVSSYLVLERRVAQETLKAVASSADRIIDALHGVEVVRFGCGADCAEYMIKRFRDAKHIDDITWGTSPRARSGRDVDAMQKFQATISRVAKQSGVVFREVCSFKCLEDFWREKERVLDKNSVSYNVGYYEDCGPGDPPRQGFVVIDKKEIVIGHTKGQVWLAIKHPDIAKWFLAYFDDLWTDAAKLKHGGVVQMERLAGLEQSLKPRDVDDPAVDGSRGGSPEGATMPDGTKHP